MSGEDAKLFAEAKEHVAAACDSFVRGDTAPSQRKVSDERAAYLAGALVSLASTMPDDLALLCCEASRALGERAGVKYAADFNEMEIAQIWRRPR